MAGQVAVARRSDDSSADLKKTRYDIKKNAVTPQAKYPDADVPEEVSNSQSCSPVEVDLIGKMITAGRLDDAYELVSSLLENQGQCDALEVIRVELMIMQSKVVEARAAVTTLLERTPRHVGALKALIKLHQKSEDLPLALEATERLILLADGNEEIRRFCADSLVEVGFAFRNLGSVKRAQELYCDALKVWEAHAAALYELGVIAMNEGRLLDAKLMYTKAVESDPGHARVLFFTQFFPSL